MFWSSKKANNRNENPDYTQGYALQPRLYEAGGVAYLTLWRREAPKKYAPQYAVRIAPIETQAARAAAEWYATGRQWKSLWFEGIEVCEDLKAFLEASSSQEEDGGDDPTGAATDSKPAKVASLPKGITLGSFKERKFAFLEERW